MASFRALTFLVPFLSVRTRRAQAQAAAKDRELSGEKVRHVGTLLVGSDTHMLDRAVLITRILTLVGGRPLETVSQLRGGGGLAVD